MKTKFIAIFAVLAMVFVGAAVIAQDNASDAEVAAFAVDSPIDAYARTADTSPATGTSHAIHYNTTGGMLAIVLSDAAYQALTTPDVAIQVVVTGGDNEGTKVYDPISKAQTVHVNMGILGTTSTVIKIANHGTTDFSTALSFTLTGLAATDIQYTNNLYNEAGNTFTPSAQNNNPASMARNVTVSITDSPANYVLIGWDSDSSADEIVLASTATLEEVLMGCAWDATGTPKAHVWAVWDSKAFNLTYNFNKPEAASSRYVYTGVSPGGSDVDPPAGGKLLISGTDYVPDTAYKLQGYTFAGWFTAPSGGTQATATSGTSIQAAFVSTNLKEGGSYTLYAHWTAAPVTVTYSLGTSGQGFTYTPETPVWNTDTVYFDTSSKVLSVSDLQTKATSASGSLSVTAKYHFSHWTNGGNDYFAGDLFNPTTIDTTFTDTIAFTPVFDYEVSITGLITGVDFQPQSRVAGYEYMIDGDEATPTYTFKLVYDNLLYDATAVTATGGTAGALGDYADGGKTCTISSITGPVAITLTLSTGYYKVTVAGDSTGQYVLDTDYTISWTKTVPNGKEGLLTVTSAKVGTSSTVYTIGTTTSNFEIVPITNSLYKIKDNRTDTSTVATVAITATKADATGGNVSNLKFTMESLTTSAATAYLRAEGYEVPSGTITVTGTAYQTEGGVTVFVGLGSTYASQYVKVPGVHSGDSPFGTDNKQPGTGYQEYQITVSNPTDYKLYSAKLTFTPSSGGSAVSTVYAI